MSLDYVFELTMKNSNPAKNVNLNSTKVKKFKVNEKNFKHLSDHYGVTTIIE